MKKLFSLLIAGALIFSAEAKKVRFSVNMTGQDVNPNGVHVSGDFQTLAGFPGGDWNSATTPLTQEGSSMVYSTVVDIPAFRKYEYKFVNGDQFYEAEFVPEISRVGYDFNDNRWLYLDSTSADTFSLGAIRFAGNAPDGMYMVRFLVDMSIVLPQVTKPYVNWSSVVGPSQSSALFSFGANVYESIVFVGAAGSYLYKFQTGANTSTAEEVSAQCATSAGYRQISLISDSALASVCFTGCAACLVPVQTSFAVESSRIFPNPVGNSVATFSAPFSSAVAIIDATGRLVDSFLAEAGEHETLRFPHAGLYTIRITPAGEGKSEVKKVVVQ